jgi:hypothetical protein
MHGTEGPDSGQGFVSASKRIVPSGLDARKAKPGPAASEPTAVRSTVDFASATSASRKRG